MLSLLCVSVRVGVHAQVCNMLWGLAATDQQQPGDLRRVSNRLVHLGVHESLDFRELRQLQQVHLLLPQSSAE